MQLEWIDWVAAPGLAGRRRRRRTRRLRVVARESKAGLLAELSGGRCHRRPSRVNWQAGRGDPALTETSAPEKWRSIHESQRCDA